MDTVRKMGIHNVSDGASIFYGIFNNMPKYIKVVRGIVTVAVRTWCGKWKHSYLSRCNQLNQFSELFQCADVHGFQCLLHLFSSAAKFGQKSLGDLRTDEYNSALIEKIWQLVVWTWTDSPSRD